MNELTQLDQRLQQYAQPLVGARLPSQSLSGLVGSSKMVILHFLRHLGCIFCRHSVAELRKLSQTTKLPPIYFVHQSTTSEAESFFDEYFPDAAHLSDPSLELYRMFGIQRLEGRQVFNPQMYMQGFQILMKGIRQGDNQGDVLVLSGTFLFNNGHLVWAHRARFAGDDPKWSQLAV